MEIKDLKEEKRQEMVSNPDSLEYYVLNLLAATHNLVKCIELQHWDRLAKKNAAAIHARNLVIEKLHQD